MLYNPNLKAFVSRNEKQIHVWSQFNGNQLFKVNFYEETKSHAISAMCYSPRYMLYFIFSADFRLHIYNANMIRICDMATKTSLQTHCFFYDEGDQLFAGGVDGCYVFQLQIINKYQPMVAL